MTSFYYLRQGLTFRVNSLTALELNDEKNQLSKKVHEVLELPERRVNVLINGNVFTEETVHQLVEKYSGNKYFFLHILQQDKTNLLVDRKQQIDIHTLSKQGFQALTPYDMILIDTSGQVRNAYVKDDISFKKFVQHLSVLLPVEQSKKIILER